MHAPERAHGRVSILPETLAGALAYLVLPAVIFLFVEPYKKNHFVRFHSFQCLGLCLACLLIGASLRLVGFVLFFLPVGRLFFVLVSMLVSLAFFVIWVVLVVKALQGERFKLPLLGDFAEHRAVAG